MGMIKLLWFSRKSLPSTIVIRVADVLGDSDLCLLMCKKQLRLRFPCFAAPIRRRLPQPSPPGHPGAGSRK
jgi:hypothetical protein